MYKTLRVLHPDCARCFQCVIMRVIVTSTDPLFDWVKLFIVFMFSGIWKPFYLQFFTNFSKWLWFSVVYELGQYKCKSCCSRNDSNPVHLHWCWCSSNAFASVCALDEQVCALTSINISFLSITIIKGISCYEVYHATPAMEQ